MRGTLLMAAVATQQLELIELLLSAGASVHVTDAFGSTVISAASCPLDHQPIRCKLAQGVKPTASRRAVLQRLMAAGADPNVQDRLGLSALMVAAISGEAECVRVLMQGAAAPYISLYLPIPPYISLYLPLSPSISLSLSLFVFL